ncbi:MAG TPA: serine/threonine-protein kinase [Polyangiaceae bacterium]|nr:serine/threonine-protein kinase [Polyangiaceae bacterium]
MAAALESRTKQPTQLGRYALFDQIAQGGMATVHLGRLIGPIGFSKIVAIKQMHESAARNPDFVAMFLDEARLSGRVQHPNVVATFDVIASGGEAFLVMEYVHGESLSALLRATRLRAERLAPAFAVHILCDVLAGLHAAHEATDEHAEPLNLIHRDVSPQNIMVGVDGVARVLDFGIAKAAGRLQETQTGQLKGKLGYMAPEQLLGRPLDRRVDIFAAGICLWESISGRKMFDADNSGQLMYQVLETDIPPLSAIADVSPALSRAVERAISRDPNERFATARDFARELEQSTELVSPRQIGDWVTSLSGEALSRRFERLRAIEATPLTTTTAVVARASSGFHERDSFHPAGEDALTEPAQADASGAQPTASATPSSPHARKRAWFFGVALGALVLLGGGAFAALRASSDAIPASPSSATASAAPVTAAPSVAPTATTVTGSAAPGPTESGSAAPSASAIAPTKAAPATKHVAKKKPARAPAPRPEDLFSRK